MHTSIFLSCFTCLDNKQLIIFTITPRAANFQYRLPCFPSMFCSIVTASLVETDCSSLPRRSLMSSSFATITERLLKGAPHPHTSAKDQTMRNREARRQAGTADSRGVPIKPRLIPPSLHPLLSRGGAAAVVGGWAHHFQQSNTFIYLPGRRGGHTRCS